MSQREWTASFESKCRFTHELYWELFSTLTAVTLGHHGQDALTSVQWNMVRRHQRNFFLPALKKLGLENEKSDAIAAAKFHVLSNEIGGGLNVDYIEESPQKVWIRYNPPSKFGSFVGATLPQVHNQFWAGWHAYNGRSLGNPRLGYVSCHMICQGDPYDAGYFKIYDHDLDPEECLQFSQGERLPPVDPAVQPRLGEDWTPERRLRALRNYGVEFAYEITRALLELFGVGGARALVEQAAAINTANHADEIIETLELKSFDAEGIATFIERDRGLLEEEVEIEKVASDEYIVRQKARNPRLFSDPASLPVEIDEAFLKGWRIFLELVNRDLTVDMTQALSAGHSHYEWHIHPRSD